MDIDERAEYLEGIGLHLGWNKGLVKCQVCHDRWHPWRYETCYDCRPPWLFNNRKEFSESQKIDIFGRDDYKCQGCGTRNSNLQIDHIMPCARGGEANQWNGQVLCDKCNYEKAGDWKSTRWPKKRNKLMHYYLSFWWSHLDHEEQKLLVEEASNKRMIIGYRALSGMKKTTWLQEQAAQYKIVIDKATPMVRFVGDRLVLVGDEQSPVGDYVNVLSAMMEEHRPFNHGGEFARHSRVNGNIFREPPQWAIDEADAQT